MTVGGLSNRQPPSLIGSPFDRESCGSELPIGGSEPFSLALIQNVQMTPKTLRPCCFTFPTAAILIVLFIGCSQGKQSESTVQTDDSSTARRESKITILPGTWDSVLKLVEQNHGKIVVVDIWSTSCLPCIEELPRLAEIQRSMPDDVVCVSFNIDYAGIASRPPESNLDRIRDVLESCYTNSFNLYSTTEADVLFQDLDLSSIPAVYVYSRNGTLVKRFDASLYDDESDEEDAFTYERDVEPLVRRLVESD